MNDIANRHDSQTTQASLSGRPIEPITQAAAGLAGQAPFVTRQRDNRGDNTAGRIGGSRRFSCRTPSFSPSHPSGFFAVCPAVPARPVNEKKNINKKLNGG